MPIKDDCTPTSDDWKPGDLALCVKGGQLNTHDINGRPLAYRQYPRQGMIYLVDDAHMYQSCVRPYPNLGLVLRGGPINGTELALPIWPAFRFRKIHPLSESEVDKFSVENLIRIPHRKEPGHVS